MQSSKLRISKLIPRQQTGLIATFVIAVLITWLAVAGILTWRTLHLARTFQFSAATQQASQTLWLVQPLSALTFHAIPDIESWRSSLITIKDGSELAQEISSYLPLALQNDPTTHQLATNILTHTAVVTTNTQQLSTQLTHSWIIKKFLGSRRLTQIHQAALATTDASTVIDHVLPGQHHYIVLLQNSEELRATGGFMGSFADIELNDGAITQMKISDIYEPDGQFTSFVPAPAGLNEYLSSGKGMRLPDANWHPDFPTAAQDILQFFARGNTTSIDGVVVITLPVIQDMLVVTGPVYLPDYQQSVTAENIAELARADRDEFFAGSQQKKHFLQALLNQLKIKLAELTPDQRQHVLSFLRLHLRQKNLQFFSHDATLQELFQQYGVAGQVTTQPLNHFQSIGAAPSPLTSKYLMLVESNVGINKANKFVVRSVYITSNIENDVIRLTFQNLNQPEHRGTDDNLHYMNYQRLLVSPETEVQSVIINTQKVDKIDESIITTATGQQFKQIGFLLTVPEQSETVAEITLQSAEPHQSWVIQKQAGLPPTEYVITVGDKQQRFILDQDTVVNF